MDDDLLTVLRAGTRTMPAAPDARSEHVSVNGVRLHVVQAGPADGPLVLLLHGCPEFWWGWRHQIGALAHAGFRVWAPDQRGYNLSDKPRGVRNYRLGRLADDAAALIEAAGRERACVVGHDWGGGVAWWLALHAPEYVERLAMLNAPHPLAMRHALLTSPRQMLRSWYMLLFALPWLPEALFGARDGALWVRAMRKLGRAGTFTDEELRQYRASWARPGALRGMFHWYRGLVGQRPPRTARVTQPTLLIWGAQDSALGRELVQPSLQHCAAGRLALFETATHWVQHDEPARVSELLIEHLRPASGRGQVSHEPTTSRGRGAEPDAGAGADVPSPCNSLCELDTRSVCTGCGRTMTEIAGWTGFDSERRLAVRAAAEARLGRRTSG